MDVNDLIISCAGGGIEIGDQAQFTVTKITGLDQYYNDTYMRYRTFDFCGGTALQLRFVANGVIDMNNIPTSPVTLVDVKLEAEHALFIFASYQLDFPIAMEIRAIDSGDPANGFHVPSGSFFKLYTGTSGMNTRYHIHRSFTTANELQILFWREPDIPTNSGAGWIFVDITVLPVKISNVQPWTDL